MRNLKTWKVDIEFEWEAWENLSEENVFLQVKDLVPDHVKNVLIRVREDGKVGQ